MKNYIRSLDYHDFTAYYNEEGLHHRLDGPAIQFKDGSEEWKVNGKYNRVKAPACIFVDNTGTKFYWYKNGECHRLNAPACYKILLSKTCIDKEFYIFGKQIK